MLQLIWARAAQGGWPEFQAVDLSQVGDTGVFVIWHGGAMPRTIRVGYGSLAQRIAALRRDTALLRYRQFGPLFMSWAAVPSAQMAGVAKFVGSRLRPAFEDRLTMVTTIPATLPA